MRTLQANNSIFNSVRGNQHNVTNIINMALSEDHMLNAALKPVERRKDVSGCMDGTRADILNEVDDWLDNFQDKCTNLLWISGSPGAGKSAIAATIVSMLWKRDRLGSSFFFKRNDALLSDPTVLWRTVASDLAQFDPVLKRSLVRVLMQKVDSGADILLHFDDFIAKPLLENHEALAERHPVIVIDALDECGLDPSQASQRRTLIDTIMRWTCLSSVFKLIVTSRDERLPQSFRDSCYHISLETGDSVTDQSMRDIHLFFEKRLAAIAATFPSLPRPWPDDLTIWKLTQRAAGVFVWAETVMRFMEEDAPDKQLQCILRGEFHGRDNPLDALYRQILDIAFNDVSDIFKIIVGAIVVAKIPLRRSDLKFFIGRKEEETAIDFILNKLSCLISIADEGSVRLNHPSFADFLCNSSQCPVQISIDKAAQNRTFVIACFQLMSSNLKFNICNLATSYLRNDQIDPTQINESISSALSYSCLYWAHHLSQVVHEHAILSNEIATFLHVHLLHWLEVLSFLGQIPKASAALSVLAQWIGTYDAKLLAFTHDAMRFIINFQIPMSESAPQIYLSALPFSPRESVVANHFRPQFQMTLSVVGGQSFHWPPIFRVFVGHTDSVHATAYSPNGRYVASGSGDKTICIWDVETDQMVLGPLRGHAASIYAVAFSPNGKYVVSGSKDKSLCVWNVETGQIVSGPLTGHRKAVRSVAFFPDGERIVSGADDCTICIWEVKTGQLLSLPLEGHARAVLSVAVSPDGRYVVSGSADSSVCVWDVAGNRVISGPFDVHSKAVTAVAFSPLGDKIATGSKDRTVSMWDPMSGQQMSPSFRGHTDAVCSIAFSPSGDRVASCSGDRTIYIWNAVTSQIISGPFGGHTHDVKSISFSPNGKYVVSGSRDKTVCIWDAQAGSTVSRPIESHKQNTWSIVFSPDGRYLISGSNGAIGIWDTVEDKMDSFQAHEGEVYSIALSPDGTNIASASSDNTICIWSLETHQMVSRPFQGHSDWVCSIAYSASGDFLVSGSQDETVCIWDVRTAQVTAGPLKGHMGQVCSVAFSPNSKFVASGSVDQAIYLWDAQTGHILLGPIKCNGVVWCVTFTPDGRYVVAGLGDKTICIWDVKTGDLAASPFRGHTDYVHSVALSRDGRWMVSGSGDKTVCVWDVKTGKMVSGPFEGHTKPVWCVAFSPDGGHIASCSSDKTIRIWDTRAHRLIHDHYLDFSEGWVFCNTQQTRNANNLLFWVPPESQRGICGEETSAIMGAHLTSLDLGQFVHGSSWSRCHTGLGTLLD